MNNVWICTDLHLYSRDNDAHHPFRSRHNIGKLADGFAKAIQEDDLFIFLGDLCDPGIGDPKVVEALVKSIPCHRIMCRGNHDIQDDTFYLEAGFHEICDIIRIHNIIFSHKPIHIAPDEINIHGHLHTEKMSTLGYQHINAYAANWNDNDAPVLLDDLLASATVQDVEISKREAAHIAEKFEKYTSYEGDHYSSIIDLSDQFQLCPVDEAYVYDPRKKDLRLSQICEFNKDLDAFVYGLAINGVIDNKRNTTYKDWDKYYRLADPNQFARQHGGQCWDYVTYEASIFKRDFQDVLYDTYYIMFNIAPDYPTHTFLIFHRNGEHYLFEQSFALLSGITRSKSVDDLISCEITHLTSYSKLHTPYELRHCPRYICTYDALDPNLVGMNCVEFMNYMVEHGKEYKHKYKELYQVSRFFPPSDVELAESAAENYVGTPSVLYHGSSQKLSTLTPHVSTHGASYVYSSPSKTFALAYAGEQWDDFDLMQGSVNGIEYLAEVVPGAFNRIFKNPAYLYELPTDTFSKLNKHEWVSTEPVKPISCTKVINVIDELKCNGVKIYRYPNLPPHVKDRDAYIDDKCKAFNITRADIQDRLQMLGECADDILDEILFDDPESTKLWLADDEKWQDKERKAQEKQTDTADIANESATQYKTISLTDSQKKDLRDIIDSMTDTEKNYVGNGYFIEHFNIHYLDIRKVAGKPAGFIVAVTRKDGPKAFVIIGVSSDTRGNGLGKSMLSKLLAHYRSSKEFTTIEYNVDVGNDASEKLALSCGMLRVDSKKGDDEIHFEFNTNKGVNRAPHGSQGSGKSREEIKQELLEYINEDAAETHSLDRESKSDVASKYGLRNVGNTHDVEEQEAAEERKRELDRKKQERQKEIERGKKKLKRERFLKKVKSHLPGVKNEDADAVDGSDAAYLDGPNLEKDSQGRLVRKPYDITNDFQEPVNEVASSYQFMLQDKVQFFDRIDEAAANDKELHPVYVIIVHTGTLLSNVIKNVTGAEFSHSSISFDSKMNSLYSFARKDSKNPFEGGFKKEDLHSKFFTERKVHFAIYMVPCTKEQIGKMKKRLDYFIEHASKFTYDFTGLFANFFKVPNNPEHRWFCSRFVADILNAGTPNAPLIKEPSLMRPEDFKNTNFALFVTGGDDLNKLDSKKIDTITKRLLNQLKLKKESINESTILHLYPDNPWERQVLNYQLTKIDETAVDSFIHYLKSFKVRFDPNGDIIVTRREYDQLDQHFRNSLRMIKAYESAGNVDGVKDELCRIHYMTTLINEYYLRNDVKNMRPNTKEVRKDMLDLRSVMLNAFKQHLKWVTVRDPRWNFNAHYSASVYGSDVKIPQKVITSIGKTIVTALT